jgi:hypothetical protein
MKSKPSFLKKLEKIKERISMGFSSDQQENPKTFSPLRKKSRIKNTADLKSNSSKKNTTKYSNQEIVLNNQKTQLNSLSTKKFPRNLIEQNPSTASIDKKVLKHKKVIRKKAKDPVDPIFMFGGINDSFHIHAKHPSIPKKAKERTPPRALHGKKH